ncbi:MAG: hypothetical protein LH467_10395 [Gemmatimonadaceae bacterium]|nr:hypothetical protein [Gemmatimonadaceae bacterium]
MTSTYRPADALLESARLADTPVFGDFCRRLDSYVRHGIGGPALVISSQAAAVETMRQGLVPERMLSALRLSSCHSPRVVPTSTLGAAADDRHSRAVRQFLTQYFAH